MKGSLTGRDAKVLIADAAVHIPALLHFAHAGSEAFGASMEAPARADETEFTWEGDESTDTADGAGTDDALDDELRDAMSWDALLGYVHELRPFERDDRSYREARAVAAFNAAAPMSREYKRLKPNAVSATCHVAMCVVPRQVMCAHATTHPPP